MIDRFTKAGTGWLLALLGAFVTQAPGSARAAEPAALPPAEVFFGRPELAQPQLSPSGRYVAVLVRGTRERNALALVDLQEAGSSRVLVRFPNQDIAGMAWVGDEHLVFTTVDLQSGTGEARFAPGLYSVARDGSDYRQLVRQTAGDLALGSGGLRLSYNHQLLAIPEDGSGDIILGEIEWNGPNHSLSAVRPKRLNLRTQRTRSLADGMPEGATAWLFDKQGEPHVARVWQGRQVRTWWRDGPGAAWRLLDDAESSSARWQPLEIEPDGRGLLVLQPQGRDRVAVLTRLDVASGKLAEAPLVSTPGFDFSGQLLRDFTDGHLLGVRVNTETEVTQWLDPQLKAAQAEIDALLPGRVNRIQCRLCTGEQRVLLIESHADSDPGSYLIWRGLSGKPELLGQRSARVDSAQGARLRLVRVKARDGETLPVWVTQPPAGATDDLARRPAVVLVHGGPWVRGGAWGWNPMAQFLASRGYVVIEPEFRGSAGYGQAHLRAGFKRWGTTMQDDLTDAVRWMAAEKLIDPGRVCIAGGSYGGYAALMAPIREPGLYRCAAAWAAVTDLPRLFTNSVWWRDDTSDIARSYTMPARIGDPVLEAERLRAESPVLRAAELKLPVLLAHGSADRRVPLIHALDMRQALQAAGNEPVWIEYEGEGHGWRRTENLLDFATRLESFLARHLAAKPPG